MATLNRCFFMGNLTRDPQLSYLPSQMAVAEFGLAINEKRKQQDGSYKDIPCFVDCQVFGKRAEVVNKYFKKGQPIFIEGRLKFESWTAQDGSKRSKHRIFVTNFEFLGTGPGKKESDQGGDDDDDMGAGDDDDIPF